MVDRVQEPRRVHLVGIGGAGLSAIASVLLQQGYVVSGSDLRASAATQRLTRLGARVCIGHAAANLGDAEVVVVSSAVAEGNPEVDEALRRGVPVLKRADWLKHMLRDKRRVAVAGTHGKTTTTAMIAWIAQRAGLQPGFIIGGEVPQLGGNAAIGSGDLFIIEADEYDRTFLALDPEVAVITVIEWDHPDCYPTPQDMVDAFRQFAARVPAHGLLVGCGDEAPVREVLASSQTGRPDSTRPLTYGLQDDNDWQAVQLQTNARGGYDFVVRRAGRSAGAPVPGVSLAVPGVHNVKNALAALVVAERLGISMQQAVAALAEFAGVDRRFEIKGEAQGVLVIDDYAHHPTEIRATLAAARARYPDRPLWAVFQPHTYSRTRALLDGFATSFAEADHVIVLDIFAAREVDDGTLSSRDLVARMRHPHAHYVASLADAVAYLEKRLTPGSVLITLGAGDGYLVGERVLERLERKQ